MSHTRLAVAVADHVHDLPGLFDPVGNLRLSQLQAHCNLQTCICNATESWPTSAIMVSTHTFDAGMSALRTRALLPHSSAWRCGLKASKAVLVI